MRLHFEVSNEDKVIKQKHRHLYALFKFLLVSPLGPYLSGVIETISLSFFEIVSVPGACVLSDLMDFHVMEESEHSIITVERLKDKTIFILRILTFPICEVLVIVGWFILTVIMEILE